LDSKIALDKTVKTAGMDVLSTHGSPGRVTLLGINGFPVELSAPIALSTNSERFLVASCSTACDAAAMQRLADRTGKIVGGYLHPVSFNEGTDFLTAIKWTWQEVDIVDDLGRINTVQRLLPQMAGEGGRMSVVPVWFVPQEAAAAFYQELRAAGYAVQQSEYLKDVIE
jgi:hypothetical protein